MIGFNIPGRLRTAALNKFVYNTCVVHVVSRFLYFVACCRFVRWWAWAKACVAMYEYY